MNATLHLGDCFDIMPSIAPGSVDLILADLPYGATQNGWDSQLRLDRLWELYRAITKPTSAIVLTSAQRFTIELAASNLAEFQYGLVWVKNRKTGNLNAKRRPMIGHEDVCVFYRQQPTFNIQLKRPKYKLRKGSAKSNTTNYGEVSGRGYTKPHYDGMVTADTVLEDFDCETGLHPTQKPVSLMAHLINTFTNPGDLVLDNCMGSGTTGVAALQTGRRFYGIEKDAKYFEIAQSRIDAEGRQSRLLGT